MQKNELTYEYMNDGLSNFDLKDIAKNSGIKIDDVFAEDQLENLPNKELDRDYNFIINTSKLKDKKNKLHWYSVVLKKNPASIMVFDSLGQNIHNDTDKKKLLEEIEKKSKVWYPDFIPKLKENLIEKENKSSKACGLYALQFIKRIEQGESFKEATEFNKQTKEEQEQLMYENPFEIEL